MLTGLRPYFLLAAVPASGDENMKLAVVLLLTLSFGGSIAAFLCTILVRKIINKRKEKKN